MADPADDDRTDSKQLPIAPLDRADVRTPFLLVVAGRMEIGKLLPLRNGPMVIGRALGADIRLEDDSISRRHAEVQVLAEGGLDVLDLGSRNGTWFNGVSVDRVRLSDGDKFQVGSGTVLKFAYQDSLETQAQQNLYESSTIDALTRLYNKKSLLDSLERELRYALRHMEPLSVLMVDVDRFKLVNDTYGHLAGDQVLQVIARRVVEAVRCEDVVARYGGEELAVVLRGTPAKEAIIVGERIRRSVAAEPIEFEGKKLEVTVSVGVAGLDTGENTTTRSLLERADQNLYRAKERGRNRVEGPSTTSL